MDRVDYSALLDVGWDDAWHAAFGPYRRSGAPGRVSRTDRGGLLTVETAEGTKRARRAPGMRRTADPTTLPTVGDWVVLGEERIDGAPVVDAVLPRRTAIIRQSPEDRGTPAQVLAANVDTALIVVAVDDEVNHRRLDRYLALAWQSGATPVLVLSKADQCPDVAAVLDEMTLAAIGVPAYPVNALTGEGVDALLPHLQPGRTGVLLGMSGAGKSTLANRLLGQEVLAARAVRDDGRGRHTTTHRQLLRLPSGGTLIDTPGLRQLGLWDAGEGIAETFGDIEELAARCRFGDCRHGSEPGCAVQAAIADGSLPTMRLGSYRKLQREREHQARKRDPRLQRAHKNRWRQIHKDLRSHPRYRDD
ncbi:MAG: ribosome small subunit-dependent GTPase A [Nitriliruptorales bacterium]|nr:ribosome small subunit-dependent GTPase A [Nitriliruptorales bacterium]